MQNDGKQYVSFLDLKYQQLRSDDRRTEQRGSE